MTTLTRIVAVVGVALLAAPAFSQDVPRRQDPGTGAPAGPPPFGGRRGFGGFRGAVPPVPRVGPVEGFQDTQFQKTIDNLGERGTIDVSNTVGQVRIIG